MQWLSVTDFFNMGGYAFYVWSSFCLTALVAVIEIVHVRACRRKILRQWGCDAT
jgi:heme exporter protein D